MCFEFVVSFEIIGIIGMFLNDILGDELILRGVYFMLMGVCCVEKGNVKNVMICFIFGFCFFIL